MKIEPINRIEICPSQGETTQLLAAGDFCLRDISNGVKSVMGSRHIYSQELLSVLGSKDVSIVNHECPFAEKKDRVLSVGRHLLACPATIDALKDGGFDTVVLANNHILDYGENAMFDTRSKFEKAGIKTVGVGQDIEEANRPLLMEVNEIKLAICAFAEEEFCCATECSAGAAKLAPVAVANVIADVRRSADIVVVYVHGGNEYYPVPSPRINKWYRFFIDCGADAVIGTHPHTMQGAEVYKNKPIIYSLGNFCFYSPEVSKTKCWHYGLIVKLAISGGKICSVERWVCRQAANDNGVKLEIVEDAEGIDFRDLIRRLDTVAADPVLIREFWKWFCEERRATYLGTLKLCSARADGSIKNLIIRALRGRRLEYLLFNIWGDIINKLRKRRRNKADLEVLRNLVLCPAHNDLLSSILEMERLGIKPKKELEEDYKDLMRFCR